MHSTFLPAFIAGIIEGVVEWLPVSSKTMITLYFAAIGVNVQSAYALGLIANFGSFFAALFYFRREVWGALKSLRHPFADEPYARLLRFVVVGTLATGVIGIPLYVLVQHAFSLIGGSIAMLAIGAMLLVTTFIVRSKERLSRKAELVAETVGDPADKGVESEEAAAILNAAAPREAARPVGMKATLITGAAQGLAALPGISRSAVTMTPLLWMGFSAEDALRLSFMLDVLGLIGAGVVPVVVGHGGRAAVGQFGVGATIIMLVVAAIVSFLAIRFVLSVARKLRTWIVTLVIAIITLAVPLWAIIGLH